MRSRRFWKWAMVLVALAALGSACGDDTSDGDGGDGDAAGTGDGDMGAGDGDNGAAAATWTEVWDEIIVGTGCNGGALCHGGAGGNLELTDKDEGHAALVNVAAMGVNLSGMPTPDCQDSGLMRVVPGDSAASLLMQKVEDTQTCGDPMPPAGMLTADQIEMVRSWIDAGALNN